MQWTTNKLIDLKKQYLSELQGFYEKHEALSLINILVDHFFELSSTALLTNPDYRVSESEMLKLHFAVKDLKKFRPVQYIVGETEFYNLKIKVTDAVLIPRPETEELVQLILAHEKEKNLSVLDIGTGSGCIAIALQKKLDSPRISAIDISTKALQIAKTNSSINNVEIDFLEFNILNENKWSSIEKYDLIVSNPPYVTQAEKKQMSDNVLQYEPWEALFVANDDPLVFYQSICRFGVTHLNTGGRIYFEINENKSSNLIQLILEFGYQNVSCHQDIHGKDRFVSANL